MYIYINLSQPNSTSTQVGIDKVMNWTTTHPPPKGTSRLTNICLAKFFSQPKHFSTKFLGPNIFRWPKLFLTKIFFFPKYFQLPIFFWHFFWEKFSFNQKFFSPKIFIQTPFLTKNVFWLKNIHVILFYESINCPR